MGRFETSGHGQRLFWGLHVVGALAHLAGLLTTVGITSGHADVSIPLYGIRVDAREHAPATDGPGAVVVSVSRIGDIMPVPLVYAWFGCSLLFHLLVLGSWACGRADWYWRGLRRNVGWWRWLEYFFSASIMLLAASAILTTRELRVVVASTVLIATTMAFGYATELVSHRWIVGDVSGARAVTLWSWLGGDTYVLRERWDPSWASLRERLLFHVVGYVPFVTAWWLVFDALHSSIDAWVDSDAFPSDAAESLWAGFGLFTAFGAVQLALQLAPYGPSWYWTGEVAYCVLSVAAKWTMGLLLLFRGLTAERVAAAGSVEVSLGTPCE